jgi:hypothetical protein
MLIRPLVVLVALLVFLALDLAWIKRRAATHKGSNAEFFALKSEVLVIRHTNTESRIVSYEIRQPDPERALAIARVVAGS